jgi:hypothetical protein
MHNENNPTFLTNTIKKTPNSTLRVSPLLKTYPFYIIEEVSTNNYMHEWWEVFFNALDENIRTSV